MVNKEIAFKLPPAGYSQAPTHRKRCFFFFKNIFSASRDKSHARNIEMMNMLQEVKVQTKMVFHLNDNPMFVKDGLCLFSMKGMIRVRILWSYVRVYFELFIWSDNRVA